MRFTRALAICAEKVIAGSAEKEKMMRVCVLKKRILRVID